MPTRKQNKFLNGCKNFFCMFFDILKDGKIFAKMLCILSEILRLPKMVITAEKDYTVNLARDTL